MPLGRLPAAHGENHRLGLNLHHTLRGGSVNLLILSNPDHRGLGNIGDPKFLYQINKTLGIFRAA